MSDVIVLGRDRVGIVAEHEGFRYYLTECCAASAKGMQDYVGCRSCYDEIDPALGGCPDKEMVLVDGKWTFRDVPLELTEVFGDGIPWEQFVKQGGGHGGSDTTSAARD